VRELGGGESPTTNNRMELMGTIGGLESIRDTAEPVIIYTDSTYVIRGITQWVWGWRQRGWRTAEGGAVANQELWEELVRLTAARRTKGGIDWRYVRGHSGIPGNERVDAIAVAFSKGQQVQLYHGSVLKYDVAIHDLPESGELPEMRPKQAKQAAFSYLSLVDGVPMRHKTWPECERRVKGRAGARFKKALSEADEQAILSSWGVRL
jgi:ribonuclease HI